MNKVTRRLIPAIFMLVIALVFSSTASYAWFSMNREVAATGMQVKAEATSSLVILGANTLGATGVGTTTTATFGAAATELVPATHDSTWATYANGLKKIDAATEKLVDAGTGYAAAYTYTTTAVNNEYVDYIVYIASAGGALANQDLKVEFDAATKALVFADVTDDTKQAVSIDFYVDTVSDSGAAALVPSAANFKGTISLKNRATDVVTLVEDGAIPVNKDKDNGLRILMRVYFDGALEKTTGQAYVYSNSVNTADVSFGVKFVADTHVGG